MLTGARARGDHGAGPQERPQCWLLSRVASRWPAGGQQDSTAVTHLPEAGGGGAGAWFTLRAGLSLVGRSP